MTQLVNYLIGATSYMAVLYIFFLLMLSNDTHYRRNRAYLLISLCLALLLPLIKFDLSNTGGLSSVQDKLIGIISLDTVTVTPGGTGRASSMNFLWIIYISGVLVNLIMTLIYSIRIYKIIQSGKIEGTKKVYTNFNNISGFSAFGYIFISTQLDPEEERKVEEHEMKHIDQNHFADLVFLKIITIVFWFNPIIYLFNRSLKAIHEYQADAIMIDEGENPASYTSLLLNQVFRTKLFSIQNAFANKTLIKKRIIMMTKQKTKNVAGLKLLLILPLTLLMFFIFSCSQEEKETLPQPQEEIATEKVAPVDNFKKADKMDKAVFVVVEDMPSFKGGDMNDFRQWVQMNVKYPIIAVENGIQGKVFVSYTVNEDGSVSDAEVIQGVDPSLDQEVLRVVNSSPLWEAGMQSGIKVAVRFTVVVNFQLS